MAFQMTLNKLDLPYTLPEFNAERGSEPATVNSPREAPTQIIRKKKGHKTVPSPEKKINRDEKVEQVVQDEKVGSDFIPSIENFREFRSWLLKKLGELENIT